LSARKCSVFGLICCISYALLHYSSGWAAELNALLGGNIGFLLPFLRAALAFLIPGAILSRLSRPHGRKRAAAPKPSELLPFSLSTALFLASLGFFMAYFYGFNYILPYHSALTPADTGPYFIWLIFGLAVPVIIEEFFLRGVFYRSLARFGTIMAALASSILNALLQNSTQAFWGALISGIIFCLMAEFVSSFLPAAIARVVCVLYYRFLIGLVNTYQVYGLEYVFLLLNLIIMLASCYFLLLYIERFLQKGRRIHYRKIPRPVTKSISTLIFNPGMLMFYVLYIMILCNVI
jgi:membrane protease YdiL (CAAX protease family)